MEVEQNDSGALNNKLLKALGDAVQTRRLQISVSQDDLAKIAGLSRSMVVRLEHGLLDPDLSTLYRIASALDCNVHEILDLIETALPASKE